ncbi:MAG: Calx-beta domain-containing protein, partial [Cyanobacteria bacterium J06636_16]
MLVLTPVSISSSTASTVTLTVDPIATASIISGPDGGEPGTAGAFTVSLSKALPTSTTITYTIGGTATAGEDYEALSGTVDIPAEATTATINVGVLDD